MQSFANAINDSGEIVGEFDDAGDWKAYLFDGTNYITLLPPGASGSNAYGINNSGIVTVQWCCDIHENSHSSLFDGTNYTSIDVPGATNTYAYNINSAGDVVFRWYGSGVSHGALLTGGKYYFVEPSGCRDSEAFAVNDHHIIVGFCDKSNRTTYWVTY
jgi:uncharacterized membrane protein